MAAHGISRRTLLQGAGATASLVALTGTGLASVTEVRADLPLGEFGYDQVSVRGTQQVAQRETVSAVLMGLDEDSLLKPFREMAGMPGPGASLGGWYEWKADYNYHHDVVGLAPGSTLGQWISALSRLYAGSKFGGAGGRADIRERILQLNMLLSKAIRPQYFAQTRFPGYSFDKLLCGLMDAHRLAGDGAAFSTLDTVRAAVEPVLPGHAVDREVQWKMGMDLSWMWDETYTMPENLFLVSTMGAGPRYRRMAEAYLDDATYFEPLSRGVNVLSDRHAYSYVNALCSAMQAYLVAGSRMHLAAAVNGFSMLERQSYATGGWGPDEMLRRPGYDDLAKSVVFSHNNFETPCGSYAHMKLTRYLLRATRDGRYGDSMERVMHNTVMGALPLQADGRSFYYSDYNVVAKRVYSLHRWPCCSGTLPQVVADYGINGYLQERGAVWVNLYQPSELRWTEGSKSIALEQTGGYPFDSRVRLQITASEPATFALRLRIPEWAGATATLKVNGHAAPVSVVKGFASIDRLWRTGDVVELELPMALRMEGLPTNGGPAQVDTVAAMWGPLVLFVLRQPGESGPLSVDRNALLESERTGPREWSVRSTTGVRAMVPFVDVGDREYTTYVNLV
jgi:DUF1680 family protein